ncbi:MAG: SRPBCC family protein [Halioglobus sp.]
MPQITQEEDFPGGLKARTRERAVLDKARYTDPALREREWEKIWSRCWLFAGLVADIPEAGDYFLYELGSESVVVMRDEDGNVGAFYNVCQHRGNRIFSSGTGWVKEVVCPYHGWRYGLNGTLAEVPDAERFCPSISKQERSLKTVRVEVWAGLVWLNFDPDAGSLAEYLGPIMSRLEPYRFEKMLLAQHQTVALDANWKTVRDNFLEQYHVDFIHPQHAGFVDCCNSTNTLWPMGHSATVVEGFVTNSRYPVPEAVPEPLQPFLESLGLDPATFLGRVPEVRAAVQQRKREVADLLGHDYSSLSDEQLSDVWQYDIFPNSFMTINPEEVWIFGPRPHPTDHEKCFLDKFTLQIPVESGRDDEQGLSLHPALCVSQDAERPEHDCFTRDDVLAGTHSLTITIDQDIQYLPDMQAGMRSRGFTSAVLNADEVRIQHFHDWVDAWCADD